MTDTGASWVFTGQSKRGVANDGVPTLLADNTLTSLTGAPGSGLLAMVDDILIGVDAACYLSLKEETSGTLLCPRIYFPGAGFYQITPRNGLKTFTAAKKVQGQLSTTANCSILLNWHVIGSNQG